MRWQSGDRSNIEDQRASSGRRGAVPIGIGGLVLLLALSWATGTDFLSLVGGGGLPTQEAGQPGELRTTPEEERMVDFVDAVMADAQSSWEQLLGGRVETHGPSWQGWGSGWRKSSAALACVIRCSSSAGRWPQHFSITSCVSGHVPSPCG